MIRNLVTSLLKWERIETTVARAKDIRKWTDKMITYGKDGTRHSLEKVSGFVWEKPVVRKVFQALRARYVDRPGGYTRVMRTRFRRGDCAPLAYIELVDRPGELRPARPVRPFHQEEQLAATRAGQTRDSVIYDREYADWEAKRPISEDARMTNVGLVPLPQSINWLPEDKLQRRTSSQLRAAMLNGSDPTLPNVLFTPRITFPTQTNHPPPPFAVGQHANTQRQQIATASSAAATASPSAIARK